eukprot:4319087-Pyramimonas_sp.AAC.1
MKTFLGGAVPAGYGDLLSAGERLLSDVSALHSDVKDRLAKVEADARPRSRKEWRDCHAHVLPGPGPHPRRFH